MQLSKIAQHNNNYFLKPILFVASLFLTDVKYFILFKYQLKVRFIPLFIFIFGFHLISLIIFRKTMDRILFSSQ